MLDFGNLPGSPEDDYDDDDNYPGYSLQFYADIYSDRLLGKRTKNKLLKMRIV